MVASVTLVSINNLQMLSPQSIPDIDQVENTFLINGQEITVLIQQDFDGLRLILDGKGQSLILDSFDFVEDLFIQKTIKSISIINSPASNITVGEIIKVPFILENDPNSTIANNIIGNFTDSTYTCGIKLVNCPNTEIYNNTIFNVTSTSNSVSGIHLVNSGNTTIRNNTIKKITSTSTDVPRDAYGIQIETSEDVHVFDVIIEDLESSSGNGYGILASYSSDSEINDSFISDISSSFSQGIHLVSSERLIMKNNTIANVTSTSNFVSGIHLINSQDTTIRNNTIKTIASTSSGFDAPRDSYGILINSSQGVHILDTSIEDLDSNGYGYGILVSSSPNSALNDSFINDINSRSSHGLHITDSKSTVVKNNSISGLSSSTQASSAVSFQNSNSSSILLNKIETIDAVLIVSGIYLDSSTGSIVGNNTIDTLFSTYSTVYGIRLISSEGIDVEFNEIDALNAPNSEAIGIYAEENGNLAVQTNTITNLSPSYGLYFINCNGINIEGNVISNIENWIYIDETSINIQYFENIDGIIIISLQTFTRPSDLTIEEGSTNSSISWVALDPQAQYYTIFLDNSVITSGTWISGSPIIHNLSSSLTIGSHTYQIVLTESSGYNITDEVEVSVFEMDLPQFITIPDDLRYLVGAADQELSWTLTDNYPSTYTIYRNGTQIDFGSWSSSVHIDVSVSGLTLGVYNCTLVAVDTSGNSVTDLALVFVLQASDVIIETEMSSPMEYDYEPTESIAFNLNWTVYSHVGGTYSIYKNDGTEKTEIVTGAFDPEVPILFPFEEKLTAGEYNFTILVITEGNIAEDYVIVYIWDTADIPGALDETNVTIPHYTIPPYLFEPEGNPWPTYLMTGLLVLATCVAGYLVITRYLMVPSAVKDEKKGLKRARKTKDLHEEGKRLGAIGSIYSKAGDYKKAIDNHKQALKIFKKTGDKKLQIEELESIGNAFLAQGVEES